MTTTCFILFVLVQTYSHTLWKSLDFAVNVTTCIEKMGYTAEKMRSTKEVTSCVKLFGSDGGKLVVDDYCDVLFPKDALTRNVEITATVFAPTFNQSSSEIPITPVIRMEPSGLKFCKPVTIRLRTWRGLRFQNASKSVIIQTESEDCYSEQIVSLETSNSVEFQTWHFSSFFSFLPDKKAGVLLTYYIFYDSDGNKIVFYFGLKEGIESYVDNLSPNYICIGCQNQLKVNLGSSLTCHIHSNHSVTPKEFKVPITEELIKQNKNVHLTKDFSSGDKLVYTIHNDNGLEIDRNTLSLPMSRKNNEKSLCSWSSRASGRHQSFSIHEDVIGKKVFMGNENIIKNVHNHYYNCNGGSVEYAMFRCENCKREIADGKDLAEIHCDLEFKRERQTICGKPQVCVFSVKNPHGYCFNIVTFNKIIDESYKEVSEAIGWATWFTGYKWIICRCVKCENHIGWKYVGDKGQFFGIITEKEGLRDR